jgi:hypothetical protein
MSDDVPNLRGGRLTTAGFVLGPLLGVGVMIGGFIWQAAHYPTRDEFTQVKDKVNAIDKAVGIQDERMNGIGIQVKAVKDQGDRIEHSVNGLARKQR